jgi:multidrug efflux pump subunit AcrA (membrane-fusion protein)
MKSAHHGFAVFLAGCALLLSGCGKSGETAAKSEHGEGGAEGVAFKEGRGLTFTPEIVKAIELEVREAEERPIAGELRLTGQVFRTVPDVLASVSLSPADAALLQKQTFTGAKLVRVDRGGESANGRVDAVFALDRAPAPVVGDFVSLVLQAAPRTVLTVPRSALLDSAGGIFVYVVNGEFYLRTPVKVGARSADFVEITEGLYAGDSVVVTPVEQLRLIELRLTKGGGHSH